MLGSNIWEGEQSVEVVEDFIRKRVTTRDIEKWEVAQLNFNIEPCSRPSDLFEKLEKKRKVRHENLLAELAKNLNDVNLKSEKKITIASQELKAFMKDFNDKLEDMLNSINVSEVVSYESSVFANYQNKANEFKAQQCQLVNELYEDLIKFENERAKENEKLLRLACEELRKIGYFLPYEVQTFVEHETLKMNQLSLSNRRCYEDLTLTLTLVTEQTYKSFMDNVFCIREKWVQQKLQRTFSDLRSKAEKKIARLIPEAYARLEMKGHELIVQLTPNNLYSTCKAEEWFENVKEVVAALDNCGKNLISVYKKTLDAVFHGFDAEAEEIKAELNLVDAFDIEERVIKPIAFETRTDQIKDIEDLEMYWQETLEEIRIYLTDVKQFLLDAGKLWDRHSERVCESKKLILKALEKADKNNQIFLQDLEIKLNISLDALRQEHNQSKLEKIYETVVTTLNSLKTKYESMYLEDVATVEDFYKMMNLEGDVLSADIKEFIHEIHSIEVMKVVHIQSEQFRFFPEDKPIFKEIQMCAQQIQAVRSWKQGIWVALECLSQNTRESLQPRAESWINKKIEHLAEKKSVQLELLDKRFQRIRIEIFEKRAKEIQAHEESLKNHKKKIEFELSKMKEDYKNLVVKEQNKIDYVKENLTKVESNVMLEDRPGVIRGNQTMLEKKKEELENELKMTFERFRDDCDSRTCDLKQANVNFMKSIRLFHENGNYSSEEGKMFINMLETLDKEIAASLKGIIKDTTKDENEFIKKLSAIFNPLITLFTLLHEETVFNLETQQRLESFVSSIRENAKTLKLEIDFFKNQCYLLCKSIKNTQNSLDVIDENFWNYVITLLYKNINNLLYPIDIPEAATQSVDSEKKGESTELEASTLSLCCCVGKFSVHITHSNTYTFRTAEKDDAFSCKDYKNLLFNGEKPSENDRTFLAVMYNSFLVEADYFQKSACTFYKKLQGRKILREELISANYDGFMGDILTKFKLYNAQIEQFWLQLLIEFLTLLSRLKSLANKFLERKLCEYEIVAFKALDELKENFSSCFDSLTSENCKERETLENKLMPLHGYPHNAELLNKLEEEVVQKTASQEIKRETVIQRLKNQLACFQINYFEKKFGIDEIELFYVKIRDQIFIENLGDNLLDEIIRFCDRGEFYIKRISNENLTTKNDAENEYLSMASGEVPDEFKLDLESISENRHSVETYLHQLRQIVEKERASDVIPPTCPPCSGESVESFEGESICTKFCEPKLDILLQPLNFEERALKIKENLSNYIRLIKALADSQNNSLEQEIFRWLNKWKTNVKKVLKLYRVKYEERPEPAEVTGQPSPENNKPKTEKTSASVTSTLPRLCPTTKLDLKDISCKIPKLKSRSLRSRPSSNENKKPLGVTEHLKRNLRKSKLLEIKNSGQVGFTNTALPLQSPRNYHGQIPVLQKHSLNLFGMSPPDTRSLSPLKKGPPKEKSLNKIKTITLDQDSKKNQAEKSRSPSPVKKSSSNYRKSKSKTKTSTSSSPGNFKSSEKVEGIKCLDLKQTSPRQNSPTNKRSKAKFSKSSNLDYSLKNKSGKTLKSSIGDNAIILKQASQPSLCMNEKIIQPKEKISLDHLKNEVYSGDHRRLKFEKVHFCIEKSVENLGLGEKKRSYVVTYSSEDLQKQEEISLSFLQNLSSTSLTTYSTDCEKRKIEGVSESKSAIQTLSGSELVLTPSMKLELEKEEAVSEVKMIDILHDKAENYEEQKEVRIPQDDANEYDSEVSTDGEIIAGKRQRPHAKVSNSKCNDLHRKSANSLWKSREADLLNDVDYRQSVYHPAVSRRQKIDDEDVEFKSKNTSIDDNFDFTNKITGAKAQNRSPNLKTKYTSPGLNMDKINITNNDRSWPLSFDKTEGKPLYNSVFQDVPFYGVKRIRSKRERISGALLHFTLKVIRLFAIFNLWPGDNCHMLTSQSLRFAR